MLRNLVQFRPQAQALRMTGRSQGQAYREMTWMEAIGWMRSGKFRIVVRGARRDVHVEQAWMVQKVDVAAGADLGNGVRAAIVMGSLPVLWSQDADG
jgi:hypothetical protein